MVHIAQMYGPVNQELEGILCYLVSLRPAWVTLNGLNKQAQAADTGPQGQRAHLTLPGSGCQETIHSNSCPAFLREARWPHRVAGAQVELFLAALPSHFMVCVLLLRY